MTREKGNRNNNNKDGAFRPRQPQLPDVTEAQLSMRHVRDEEGRTTLHVHNSSTGGGPQEELGTWLPGFPGAVALVTSDSRRVAAATDLVKADTGVDSTLNIIVPNHPRPLSRIRDLASSQGVEPVTERLGFGFGASDETAVGPYDRTRAAAKELVTIGAGPRIQPCGRCGATSHTLGLCMQVDQTTGRLHGCAVCNDTHPMSSCPRWDALPIKLKYGIAIVSRGNMPPIDTGPTWANGVSHYDGTLAGPLEAPAFLPWTEQFSINWSRNMDVRMQSTIQEFYESGDRSVLPVDPATATLKDAWAFYKMEKPLRHIGAAGIAPVDRPQQQPQQQPKQQPKSAPAPTRAPQAQAKAPAKGNNGSGGRKGGRGRGRGPKPKVSAEEARNALVDDDDEFD